MRFYYLLPLLLATSAHAQDWLFVAGAETGAEYSHYGQAGIIAPLPGSSLGSGVVARAFVDGLTYRYEKNNADIDATAFGIDTSLGWMQSDKDGWWGVYAGPAWRDTDLSPDDVDNDARGGQASLRFSADADRALSDNLRVNAIVSYSAFADNAYWNRLRLMRRISGNLYAGPEVIFQGSDAYQAWQFGAALTGIQWGERGNLGLKAGVRKGEDVSAAPYAGVEFGLPF